MTKEYIEREVAIQLANNHKDGTIDANDIARIPAVDPIHEMDGCYCWKCEKENNGYCKKLRRMPTLEPLKLNTEKICLVVPIELSQLCYDLCENCKKKLEKWLEE